MKAAAGKKGGKILGNPSSWWSELIIPRIFSGNLRRYLRPRIISFLWERWKEGDISFPRLGARFYITNLQYS